VLFDDAKMGASKARFAANSETFKYYKIKYEETVYFQE